MHTNVPHIFILLIILCGVNCAALKRVSSALAPHNSALQSAQQHIGSSDPHMSRAGHSTSFSITAFMKECRAGTEHHKGWCRCCTLRLYGLTNGSLCPFDLLVICKLIESACKMTSYLQW